MEPSTDYVSFFCGNNLFPLGMPLGVIAKHEYDPNYRRVELYLYIIKSGKAQRLIARKFTVNSIAPDIISDGKLVEMIQEIAQGELDSYVFTKSEELGRDILPFTAKFDLRTIHEEAFRFHCIKNKMQEEIRFIRNHSESDMLKSYLPKYPRLPPPVYSIQEEEMQ